VIALDRDVDRLRHIPAHDGIRLRIAADLSQPLPFRPGAFDRIVASLSLHYFDAMSTERIVREVARVLRGEGVLIARVNATGDWNFGYGQGEEVEPDLFRQPDGRLKRFYTPESLSSALEPCLTIERLEPRTIRQRGQPKQTLETVARKRK
jgi:SAM-dependent methyltransferase